MEIQANPAMMLQANVLEAARSTVAAAQAAPATPQGNVDVILQLSSAAQNLMTTSR
jgi:hypothetical protein